ASSPISPTISCSSSTVRRLIRDSALPLACQRVNVRFGSASRSATLRPASRQWTARQAMVVDLPAPPLAVAATNTLAIASAMLHQPQPRGGKKEEGSPSQYDLFEIGKLPRA